MARIRLIEFGSRTDAVREMERIGVDPAGIAMMAPKQFHRNLRIDDLSPAQANILKQDALSLGAEAAVAKGVVSCEASLTGCVLSGTEKQLRELVRKLGHQPYGLKAIGREIEAALNCIEADVIVFKGVSRTWNISGRALVMGVLNVTPDSFSDGGKYGSTDAAIERGIAMLEEGADIIDVGGESTRPGAKPVSEAEELTRVIPVIEGLVRKGAAVSVDTTKAAVARAGVDAGAEIVNDISAMTRDAQMAGVVASSGAGVILMHMRGEPGSMQSMTDYGDVAAEVYAFLDGALRGAVAAGIDIEKTAVDPGIGFAKDADGSLELLRRLREFTSFGRPVLVGTSRKSFIAKALGADKYADAASRGVPTLATVCAAVTNGASIVRVHDVEETREAVNMLAAIKGKSNNAVKA
ncbi:MAG: dihydropteroate synthase [Deltaproteobacteria bacterium]|nr:dihydropteroate synthase [Deltaproteobacteria bacterium]